VVIRSAPEPSIVLASDKVKTEQASSDGAASALGSIVDATNIRHSPQHMNKRFIGSSRAMTPARADAFDINGRTRVAHS